MKQKEHQNIYFPVVRYDYHFTCVVIGIAAPKCSLVHIAVLCTGRHPVACTIAALAV